MAFNHESSCECTKSELDLFSVPPTQTSIESGTFVEFRPISTLTDGAPIEFDVTSSGDDYTDFANSYLRVIAKIVRDNGAELGWTREQLTSQSVFTSRCLSQGDSDYKLVKYLSIPSICRESFELWPRS